MLAYLLTWLALGIDLKNVKGRLFAEGNNSDPYSCFT